MLWSRTRGVKHDCTVLPSSTITGVGGGARIEGDIATRKVMLSTCDVSGITFSTCVPNTTNGQTVKLINVTISGGSENYGVFSVGATHTVEMINCSIPVKIGAYTEWNVAGNGSVAIVDGCDINGRVTLHHDSVVKYIYLKNKNKLGRVCAITSDTRCNGDIRIYANAVLDFCYRTNESPIVFANANSIASIGTLSGNTWVVGGTAAVILSGTTHHISGQGTYIKRTATDWTDFNVID